MQTDTPIELKLLGRFRLCKNGQEIRLPTGKAMLLLAFVACARDRTARRDRLASLFWQDSDVEQARASLRQALSRLRTALGNSREALWSDNEQIGLTQGQWSIDIDALIECEDNESAEVMTGWAAPFMSGVHRRDPSIDAWLEGVRQRLQQVVGRVFQTAIDNALSTGNADRALALGIRLSTLDPFAEPVHRSLMLAYELKGDRASALRQYRTLVRILDEGLGISTDEETRTLFERLRQNARPAQRTLLARDGKSDARILAAASREKKSNPSGSVLDDVTRPDTEWSQTSSDVATGLRLVAVLALRHAATSDNLRRQSSIDTVVQRQGGEPILSHGAESLYVFGLDVARTSAAEAALRTALQLQDNADCGLAPACGCASGLIGLDDNGHPIGSVVQRAARLALLADDGEFIIDRAVHSQVSQQVDVSEIDLRNQVSYRVENLRLRQSSADHHLFGRRVELAQLRQLLQDIETHGAAMALISGEAGMGKTHLMLSLEQLAQTGNCQVVRVAFSIHDASPLSLGETLARQLHDALVQTGKDSRFEEVQEITLDRLMATRRQNLQQSVPDSDRQLLLELLLSMFARLSTARPVLLIVEDCHWADTADVELLVDLFDAQSQQPVMLVTTERRENEVVARVMQSRVSEMEVLSLTLTPLSRSDAHALVEHSVEDEHTRLRILDRAGGHPLFLTQLAQANLEPDAPAPVSVVALVQTELDRLAEHARLACLRAAILGEEFSLATLEALFPDIDRSDLLHSRLMFIQGDQIRFRHALIQEAVYALLEPDDAASLHGQAALHFQPVNPGDYAHHALRSGNVQLAIDACATASEWLLSENRHGDAERIVERGLLLEPDGDALTRLLLSKMHLLRDRGDLEAAIAASRRAHDCALDAGLKVLSLIRTATLLKRRNQLERAAAQLRQASQIARDCSIPDRILAELEHEWGNNMFMRGKPQRCRQHHMLARQLAEQANDIRMRAISLGGLGDAYYAGGKLHSAHRHFSQCVQLAETADLHLIMIAHRPMMGFTAFFIEPGEAAINTLHQAVDEARQWKNVQYEMLACLAIAEPLTLALRIDESIAHVQRLRDLQSTFGGDRFGPDICHLEAMNAWMVGDLQTARKRASDGVRLFGNDFYMGAMLQGMLAAVTDDDAIAEKALTTGQSFLSDGGLAHNRIDFALYASAYHWRRGELLRAQSIIVQTQQDFGSEPVGLLDACLRWMQAAADKNPQKLSSAKAELECCNLGALTVTHAPADYDANANRENVRQAMDCATTQSKAQSTELPEP